MKHGRSLSYDEAWEEGRNTASQNFKSANGTMQSEKNTATEGGVKYSLCEFEDGRRFVDLNNGKDEYKGLTITEMNRLAVKTIKEKFAGKVIGIDNKVFVNGKTANNFAHPHVFLDEDARIAKLHLAPELDNFIDSGNNRKSNVPDGADGHFHNNVVAGFDYLYGIFKFGSQYYSGKANIKNISRGQLLGDITEIENITQDIVDSYGENPKFNFLRDASMDIIRNDSEKIKMSDEKYFSIAEKYRDGTATEEETEQLRKMVDEGSNSDFAKKLLML